MNTIRQHRRFFSASVNHLTVADNSSTVFLLKQNFAGRNRYLYACCWVVYRSFSSAESNDAATATKVLAATRTDKVESSSLSTTKSPRPSAAKAYMELAKAKLSALVVTTTAAGFIATGMPIASQLDVFVTCLVGTALCSSSAAALNQVFEVDRDKRMKRTQQRPLVKGDLTKAAATTAATLWGTAGTALLYAGTDPVTTTLGVGNILLYSGVYTYMKPRSIYNTWVGALVGAIPPVMGWSAAVGGWDAATAWQAAILASTLYLWQMPHFFALSYMHRIDYARGGFCMLPVVESDGTQTASVIVRYAWYLSAVPVVTTLTNVTSSMFALESLLLNGYALTVAHKFQQDRTNANARKVFLTSLWYLPSWLVLFLLHSKVWDEEKENDPVVKFLSDSIHLVRNKGRELCLHEQVAAHHQRQESKGETAAAAAAACPVTLTRKATVQAASMTSSVVAQKHKQATTKDV